MANHSLKQLNIIDDNKHNGNLSSVVNFLINYCQTNMGKREFKRNLVNPIYDEEVLNLQYDNIENIMKNTSLLELVRKDLYHMNDIEKLYRRMISYKFSFRQLQQVYFSLVLTNSILTKINELSRNSYDSIFNITERNVKEKGEELIDKIKTTLYIESTDKVNFFKSGIYEDLDLIQNTLITYENQLKSIKDFFETTIENNTKLSLKKKKEKKTNYINFHVTDKNGIYLCCTKHRSKLLQEEIKKLKTEKISLDHNIELDLTNITYSTATSTNNKIENTQIKFLTNQITLQKNRLENKIEECFVKFINELTNYNKHFITLIDFIISLDVLTTKTHISINNNYCKPVIEDYCKSFVNAKNMRHILIENLQTSETYVPNDINIGKDTNGILLFGTNAVGKSSFIKSLGICVILAQSGMYVPCSSFIYKP